MSLPHMLQQMSLLALLSLIVGVIPAFMAVAYAIQPSESKLALMRPLSLAAMFSGLAGFVIGAINMLHFAVMIPAAERTSSMFVGLAESLVPLGVAFGSLTLAWLLVAFGLRRQR